jgi:hypothetical protein
MVLQQRNATALLLNLSIIENGDAMEFCYNDGGRANTYRGQTGDCAVRALAIAAQLPYEHVYADAKTLLPKGHTFKRGVPKEIINHLATKYGGSWIATMRPGQGCKVHLKADELPQGRIVVRVTKHVAAVINGVLHDTYDCSRGGTRCVYGYWDFGS